MKFNVNDCVKVKLTERGRSILASKRVNMQFLTNLKLPFFDYKEDENGWSEWQLWDLMSIFGQYLYNGCDIPFEMNIIIIEKGE